MAGDTAGRLARLPLEKQRLVERLLRGRATPPDLPDRTDAMFNPEALQAFESPATRTKAGTRQFYNAINEQLDRTIFGEHAAFLNYGYVADDSPQHAQVELPTHVVNRTSVKLVLELVGDCDLTRKRVLDVGCGRGGTLSVIERYFRASIKNGVDLSPAAIAYCRRTCQGRSLRFVEGDAEALPFATGSHDIVINLESSHSYPDILSFYREVHRVLQPLGQFLYSDVFSPSTFAAHLETLAGLGFTVEQNRDITANVVRSCLDTASRRSEVFDATPEREVIAEFLSAPGSGVFAEMRSGRAIYRILRLRRS
jgi:phthiocerol/phenolphthiocerol synthesis type-I polyketide synthase E